MSYEIFSPCLCGHLLQQRCTSLVEKYGQGKFEAAPAEGSYDNIFHCADPREGYIVECVGHDWAVKRVQDAQGFATISNIGMLGKDADRVSAGARANAVKLGLAKPEAGGAFNWAETFCRRPATSGAVRQRRSSALLGRAAGGLDARAIMRVLADHADGKHPDEPWAEDVRGPVSICMHRTEQYVVPGGTPRYPGSTAASLVADFSADGRRLPVYWCGMYSPCMTLFQPVFIEGDLPPVLAVGGEKPSDDSPWWMFHRLTHDGLRAGPARRAEIRAAWRPLQDELFESAYAMAKRGRALIADGNAARTKALLTRFMAENTARMLELGRSILARRGLSTPRFLSTSALSSIAAGTQGSTATSTAKSGTSTMESATSESRTAASALARETSLSWEFRSTIIWWSLHLPESNSRSSISSPN